MGIDVFYQPIDVAFVKTKILPFILEQCDVTGIKQTSYRPENAIDTLVQLREAHNCLAQGTDYYSLQWGRCDPEDVFSEFCVQNVLEFCRAKYPFWHVRAITSIQLLPDGFPALDYYVMPKELFAPVCREFPDVAAQLETIAECEAMGGLILPSNIPTVFAAIRQQHATAIRDPENPHWFEATASVLQALQYAEQHGLAYAEAIC